MLPPNTQPNVPEVRAAAMRELGLGSERDLHDRLGFASDGALNAEAYRLFNQARRAYLSRHPEYAPSNLADVNRANTCAVNEAANILVLGSIERAAQAKPGPPGTYALGV